MKTEYVNEIKNMLLNLLGLRVYNNYLYDEDNFDFLLYNDGMIKIDNKGIFHNNDVVYDPFSNIKQAQYYFLVYCKKEEENQYIMSTGINSKTVELPENVKGIMYSLHIDSSKGTIDTNYYYNLSLCYIEAIYMLSGVYYFDNQLCDKFRAVDYDTQYIVNRYSKRGKNK